MVLELTILSIFRQSETYLPRYFAQIERSFQLRGGACHAVWVEGDSEDETYKLLQRQKAKLESLGHKVTLIKFDLKGPYWSSINHPNRWAQLSTCWNKCLEYLLPSKITVCVESDLIWDPEVLEKIIPKLDEHHQVICPMMLTEGSLALFGVDQFYDTWGFSRNGKRFTSLTPYWEYDPSLSEDDRFLQVTTGGGMIVSTYDCQKRGRWAIDSCVMHFPPDVGVFMDKTTVIHHPLPERWKKINLLTRLLRIIKYRSIIIRKKFISAR